MISVLFITNQIVSSYGFLIYLEILE